MKLSRIFTQTRREAPAGSDLRHYQVLIRAGYIQPIGSGAFALLPLGVKCIEKIRSAFLACLSPLQPLEVDLPLVQPLDLWQSTPGSGRYPPIPGGQPFIPAPSQDPAVLEMARTHLRSYRQLPVLFSRFGGTFQASPSGGGLFRSRAPLTQDLYSFHPDLDTAQAAFEQIRLGFEQVFCKISIPAVPVQALPFGMADLNPLQWFIPVNGGSNAVLQCSACGYAAAQPAARFKRDAPSSEALLPLKKVPTPECPTIESLATYLNIPASRTAKAIFLMAQRTQPGIQARPELVFCVVRGDRALNEAALLNLLQADALRPAAEAEILAAGAVPGYASPVGLSGVRVIVDTEIPASPNLVSGANESGYHLLNVNYQRDFSAAQVAEIAEAEAGCPCPLCGQLLRSTEGAILAEMGLASTENTRAAACSFIDETGQSRPAVPGHFSLSLTAVLAALAEVHQDDHGLKLPVSAAPFPVHLIQLSGKTLDTTPAANQVYTALLSAGLEPLFDDRSESPGVKFNDADLLGMPLRLTVGERSLQNGGVEYKLRTSGESGLLPLDGIVDSVFRLLK